MTENNGASVEPGADPIAEADAAREQLAQSQQKQQEGPPDIGDSPDPGSPDPEPSSDGGVDDQPVEPDAFDLSGEKTEEGVDWSAQIEEQIFKNGKFSDHFKAKLAKDRGYSKDEIQDLEAGALHRRTESIRDFMNHAGGREFTRVQEWAKSNLPKAERDAYVNAAQSKDPVTRQIAARDLLSRYRAAGGGESNQMDGVPSRPAPSGPQINSPQDMVGILNDPRGMSAGASREQYNQDKAKAAASFADMLGISVNARPRR